MPCSRIFLLSAASCSQDPPVEAGSRILSSFPPDLSANAQGALESMGVTVLVNQAVRDVRPNGVALDGHVIETRNIIWAAGNRASPLLGSLHVPLDKAGRVLVRPDLTVPGDDWVFVIGDAAAVQGRARPSTSGCGSGRHAGGAIRGDDHYWSDAADESGRVSLFHRGC